MRTTWKLRALGAVFFLLLTAVLLSNWNIGFTGRLNKRQAPSVNVVPSNYSSTRNFTLPLRNPHGHQPDLLHPYPTPTINKRARTLSYSGAVCTGQALYHMILAAFTGTTRNAQTFTKDDLHNGWAPLNRPGKFSFWDDALKQMGKNISIGERVPTREETHLVDTPLQNPFRSVAGNMVTGRVSQQHDPS